MFVTPLFRLMAEKQASDLFFTAGAPIQSASSPWGNDPSGINPQVIM